MLFYMMHFDGFISAGEIKQHVGERQAATQVSTPPQSAFALERVLFQSSVQL